MDSGEALHDDGSSSQVSWLQGGVLSAGPFAVVLVSNHHPVLSTGLIEEMFQPLPSEA